MVDEVDSICLGVALIDLEGANAGGVVDCRELVMVPSQKLGPV
jgi:hypothetical protein